VREAPEQPEDAIARRERGADGVRVEVTPGLRDAEPGEDLVGATSRDAPGVEAVLAGAATALGDVEGHRGGRAPELVGERGVTPSERDEGVAEVADEVERDFEGDERHVGLLSGGVRPNQAQAA
jgi:hypothetical protein